MFSEKITCLSNGLAVLHCRPRRRVTRFSIWKSIFLLVYMFDLEMYYQGRQCGWILISVSISNNLHIQETHFYQDVLRIFAEAKLRTGKQYNNTITNEVWFYKSNKIKSDIGLQAPCALLEHRQRTTSHPLWPIVHLQKGPIIGSFFICLWQTRWGLVSLASIGVNNFKKWK